jgi:hypothetical protein
MLCPRCYGKHVVVTNGSRVPCPECAGIGELHCCDGLREQEECPLQENTKFQAPSSKLKTEEPKSLV